MDLPHGIPSHDTLGRVLSSARRLFDTAPSKSAVHMVNARVAGAGLALGQIATDAKSNEITAIPKLLDLLSLKGCTVTTDAMGCQKAMVEKMIEQGADYLLALKGNRGTLFEETQRISTGPKKADLTCPHPTSWKPSPTIQVQIWTH